MRILLRGIRWLAVWLLIAVGNRGTVFVSFWGLLYVETQWPVFPPQTDMWVIVVSIFFGVGLFARCCQMLALRIRPRNTLPKPPSLPVVRGVQHTPDDLHEALIIGRLSPKLQSLLLPPVPPQPSPRPAAPAAADDALPLSTSASDEKAV
ncbi:MAG: hypothetical protein AB7F35_10615 [Acetobacteraceae bacterium]